MREFVEEKFLKIVFVKTMDNYADGMTKNISADTYNKHKAQLVHLKSKVE